MSRGFRQWGTLLLRLAYLGFAVLPVTLAAWPQVIAYRYPAPGVWDAYRSVAIYPTDVLVALILVCWASGRWLGLVSGGVEVTGRLPLRGRRLSWGAWGIHAAAGVLIVLGLVSVAQAPSRVIASAVVVRLGLGWLLYQFVVLEGHVLRRVVPVFALVLVVQAVVGTAQVIGQSTFPLSWIYPAWSADLRAADPGASVIQAADGIRFLRAYGTFPHPNILGGFAAVVLPLTLGRFGAARGKPQLVIAAAVLLGLSTLVLAFSRGAWLAFAAGLSISGLLWLPARRPRLRLRPLLLLGAASLILVIGLGLALRAQVMARLSVETVLELRSVVERSMLQDYAQGVIAEQPLRGVGAGNYILAVRHRVPPPVTLEPPHNVPLLVAAELGL
ncbi:MAG: hypothetical protein CL878_12535, partial [Dehalococcoidia bacterium]|nr:hypothetical protein [Dehalococcoidia bacterium]